MSVRKKPRYYTGKKKRMNEETFSPISWQAVSRLLAAGSIVEIGIKDHANGKSPGV
jgi:hypothetical protein